MNLRLFLKSFIYSLIVLIVISVMIFSAMKKNDIPDTISEEESQNVVTEKNISETATLSHYILKLENNTINIYEVYSDQSKIHSGTLDIPVSTLREIDKLSFIHGIIVENPDDILHITEDFSS